MDLKKSIEQRNAEFNALSERQKLVEIAKDVLSQLNMKKYIAKKGLYVSLFKNDEHVWKHELLLDHDAAKQQELFLNEESITCQVCARGAMVISRIRLGNTQDLHQSDDAVNDLPYYVQVFLESIFENGVGVLSAIKSVLNKQHAEGRISRDQYHDLYNAYYDTFYKLRDTTDELDPTGRMEFLFKNLIENNGDVIVNGFNFTEPFWVYDEELKALQKTQALAEANEE